MFRFAYRFASYDKPKSIGVILGIVVSVFLVGQQLGIFLFLTDAMSALVDNSGADIWVVDDRTTDANALGLLDVRIARQIESVEGVEKAHSIVIAGGTARFSGGKSAPVALIGTEPPRFLGGPWNIVAGGREELIEDGAVTIDVYDRADLNGVGLYDLFEVNGRRVQVRAETRGARGFGAVYLFTTDDRARAIGGIPSTKASAFLVGVEEGSRPEIVRDRINRTIFGVRAWTTEELSSSTVSTILATSGIAYSIGSLILFAFIAGMVIIGLTMYSAAVDRLRDYGTLKAIGAGNSYIRKLILLQALFFGAGGYGAGVLLIEGFRKGIGNAGIVIVYPPAVKVAFFVVTMMIALGGAVFAMRRIAKLEPASVFRA